MLIDQINLNQLRVFVSVYKSKSMTLAANELHLTQSGISQHIKSLEEALEVKLFDRVNKKIIPTASGNFLYEKFSFLLNEVEHAVFDLKEAKGKLRGRINIGMPVEFGNNFVLPCIGKFISKYPDVSFNLRLEFTSLLNEMLLNGEIDFAFVDEFKLDNRIKTLNVYEEKFELCGHKELLKTGVKKTKEFFESLKYIDYLKDEPVLRRWFLHHLKVKNIDLKMSAWVMDVQGVTQLILNKAGFGILPGYVFDRLIKLGHQIESIQINSSPLINHVSLAYFPDRTQSPAITECMKYLKEEFQKKKN